MLKKVLAALFVILGTSCALADQAQTYPGLLSEMRAADLIVLVKAAKAEPSQDFDPATHTLMREQVTGEIEEVYKGEGKKLQSIQIDVPYAEQSRRVDKELAYLGNVFFTSGPRAQESVVFLLNGKQHAVINIIFAHEIVSDYARIAQLTTDEAAAVELVRLYARLTLVEKKTEYIEVPLVITDDLKRYYKSLDPKSDAFVKLLDEFHKPIFDAAEKVDAQFEPAVWLASYLPEADRKKLVGMFLDEYADNAVKLENARKVEAQKIVPQADVKPSSNECKAAPTEVETCTICAKRLIGGMGLLVDPSWHDHFSEISGSGAVVPMELIWNTHQRVEDALTKATTFAGR